MDTLFADFATAQNNERGYDLADTIRPEAPKSDPARLYSFHRSSNAYSIQTDLKYKLQYNPDLKLPKPEINAWIEVFAAYYHFVGVLLAAEEAQNAGHSSAKSADWSAVYESWKEVVNALLKGYTNGAFEAWTIPCLYVAGKCLRVFAIKADDSLASQRDSGMAFSAIQEDAFGTGSKHEKLEDAARQINRIFGMCITDRNPLEVSRKWALYYITNLLFKTYFRLNSISLSKTIIRALTAANADMPPLSVYPTSHQVTFKYYMGVISFLEEDYAKAEELLEEAYSMCYCAKDSASMESKNLNLILTYLIPTKLLTKHQLPSPALLSAHPRLSTLFSPICTAIRSGSLSALDSALANGESEFVKRRVYLTLERGRDVAIRNVFRKVFLSGGYEPLKEGQTEAERVRRTRIPVDEFAAALQLAGAEVDDGEGGVDRDEVECVIANMIYKNLMKGYIARDAGKVVLSKGGAFPGTGV